MNKSLAQISILALLLSSKVHREALLKVLKETHVPTGITDSSFEGMVSLVLATNQVSFSNDELPLEGRDHTLAMHIVVKCEDMIVARVLIDNGSALNVCPMAIDDMCQEVQGKIELMIEIGPRSFMVNFQVIKVWLSIQHAFKETLVAYIKCIHVYLA